MTGNRGPEETLLANEKSKAFKQLEQQDRKAQQGPSLKKKKKSKIPLRSKGMTPMAKGGRAGYRMGGKCKLAMKGKGRAYGKNS